MRISYSALSTYQTCPLKYKYQNVDHIKEPKSKEAVFGTLIHSVMQYVHSPALVAPSLEDALDFFSQNWNEDIWADELEERAAFSQGVKMIQTYYEKNDPADFNVVDLESRFAIEIGDDTTGRPSSSGTRRSASTSTASSSPSTSSSTAPSSRRIAPRNSSRSSTGSSST